MAAGLGDRCQPFEETNYWFETARFIGVTIVNHVERRVQKSWVFLPLCFMREVAGPSELMICLISSCLFLC